MSELPENDRKAFQKAKMLWLLDVAGHPEMTLTAVTTAIACADRVWGNAKIKETQTELGALLKKGQGTVSEGCRLLVKLGFLTLRENGNRHNYSLNFDASSRPVAIKKVLRGGAALSAEERVKRKQSKQSVNQPRPMKHYRPPQIDEKDVDQAGIGAVNISLDRSILSAVGDEHYTPDPSVGDAYGIPPTSEYEDISREGPTSHFDDLDQDRAPKGAVLTDDELYEADRFFGELFAADRALLLLIKSHIGPGQFASDLEAIISTQLPCRIADWADNVGLRDAA